MRNQYSAAPEFHLKVTAVVLNTTPFFGKEMAGVEEAAPSTTSTTPFSFASSPLWQPPATSKTRPSAIRRPRTNPCEHFERCMAAQLAPARAALILLSGYCKTAQTRAAAVRRGA